VALSWRLHRDERSWRAIVAFKPICGQPAGVSRRMQSTTQTRLNLASHEAQTLD
jgi:hypothetical protein